MAAEFAPVHLGFDMLAVLAALGAGFLITRWQLMPSVEKTASSLNHWYFICLTAGSVVGAFFFGTLNLYLMGAGGIGRSIAGSLFGAIWAVEIYKAIKHIRPSTGYIYAIPFCLLVAVGRIGCYLAGLGDNTYGTPANVPWAHDFGDGVLRHPVQLYESASMLVCALLLFWMMAVKRQLFVRYGFYICVGIYGAQRFAWEFLKPYQTVLGPFNLFHVLCLLLVGYSIAMIIRTTHDSRST